MKVEVVVHDPGWAAAFDAVRSELEHALRGVEVDAIEHIGSTSVPGLAAKPVIDVDVVVERSWTGAATAALVASGYEALGELGVPDRSAFRAPDEVPRRNVYLAVAGCLSLRNHLAVRDTLRHDAWLRDEYSALKISLSTRDYRNIDEYVAAKTDLLQRILLRAGFDPGELAEIERINRRPG